MHGIEEALTLRKAGHKQPILVMGYVELDQLEAGQLDHRAKKLLSLRGKYSVITAEKDVRIDGDKILMG